MSDICFLSSRNLGDAVVHAAALKLIRNAGFSGKMFIWTFPEAVSLFSGVPEAVIVTSTFPMGASRKQFFRGGWLHFLKTAFYLRRQKLDIAVEPIGDFREDLTLKVLSAKKALSPRWQARHPFLAHIRRPIVPMVEKTEIPEDITNIYLATSFLMKKIAPEGFSNAFENSWKLLKSDVLNIGIHPSASLDFKRWPNERWRALVSSMRKRFPDAKFLVFGAPTEKQSLSSFVNYIGEDCTVCALSIDDLKNVLKKVDLFVGLDSFAVHLANSLGIPTVVLVGANSPQLFTPPQAIAVSHTGRCPDQPCGGRPKCIGRPHEYSCMIDITAEDVINSLSLRLVPTLIAQGDT